MWAVCLQKICASQLFVTSLFIGSLLRVYSPWAVSNAGNQWQSPHLNSKEAKSQLRVRHRTQPQTERRTEGSIQGARDHSTWWGNRQVNSLQGVQPAQSDVFVQQQRTCCPLVLQHPDQTDPVTSYRPYFLQPVYVSSTFTDAWIREYARTVAIWMSFWLFRKLSLKFVLCQHSEGPSTHDTVVYALHLAAKGKKKLRLHRKLLSLGGFSTI